VRQVHAWSEGTGVEIGTISSQRAGDSWNSILTGPIRYSHKSIGCLSDVEAEWSSACGLHTLSAMQNNETT
jgi:hypothetical protein